MEIAPLAALVLPWALAHALLTALAALAGDAMPPVGAYGLAFCAAAGTTLMASEGGAGVRVGRRGLAVLLAAGALLAVPLAHLAANEPVGALLHGYALLVPAACIGAALGRTVQDPAHLWPLTLVAGAADLWSVTAPEGVTRAILEGEGPVDLPVIVLSLPAGPDGIAPVLGVGDVTVTAFFVGAAAALALPAWRTRTGLLVGFAACLAVVLIVEVPVPALPFLGVAFASAQGRAAKPRLRELGLALAVSAAVVLAGTGVARLW